MRVLMATGGSVHSEQALRFGVQIARGTGSVPTILTVIKHEKERPKGEAILAHACQLLQGDLPEVKNKIRIGHPAEEIIREAEEEQFDLVIVGEKQHHGLVTRFILGATAERVVEHAPCPVIIAKGKVGPIERILLCDSGVKDPPLLSRFARHLDRLLRGQELVTLLHVMSQMSAGPGVRARQLRARAEQLIDEQSPEGQLLKEDIEILERLNVQPKPKVRHGLVVDEILAEAREGDYDLVVIGTHRGEDWRRILLDDLAQQIIVQLDRPVLVVR